MKKLHRTYELTDFSDWEDSRLFDRAETLADILMEGYDGTVSIDFNNILATMLELNEIKMLIQKRYNLSDSEFDAFCFNPINLN
ncbi:MAG: hypothetical protein AAFU57_18415 [Bacteroidota bacterium]